MYIYIYIYIYPPLVLAEARHVARGVQCGVPLPRLGHQALRKGEGEVQQDQHLHQQEQRGPDAGDVRVHAGVEG